MRSHSSCLFDIGRQSLLVDFGLYDPTRLVFFILFSHSWWTLTCTIPFVLSFSHWSVPVGGFWLVRSHSSCLFHTGQSLMVDFDLYDPIRLVFFTLVSHCWWTLACTIPFVLSFSYWSVTVGGL